VGRFIGVDGLLFMRMTDEPLVKTLRDLVSFQSVSGNLIGTEECFRYLRKGLSEAGMHTQLLRSNDFPSIFATTQPDSKNPKLILQAHMDVVPAKPEGFEMAEVDGKLMGRGVFDMKFAAACYLQLVEDLKEELGMYDFGLMLTSDEEIGGDDGVGYLLEQGYGSEVCLLPDGGDKWEIEATCNGVWFIKLTASGVSAHGSRPWEGDNAISTLVEGLDEIKGLFGELSRGKSSVTISQISGGTAINQVPDSAEATLDLRFVDSEQFDAYQKAIHLIADNRGLQLVTIAETPCGTVDMQNPHIIDFMMIAERIHGQPIGHNHSLGASDARFFAQKNIPTIVIRPTGGGHHSNSEWINRDELLKFYQLVKTYVTETTKIA
jgi:succinyl-diaminopimelate desuccinylase